MAIMNSMPIDKDTPIEQGMLTKQVESAQRKVEGNNFAVRRNVLSFDDVMNRQREIIYGQRDRVLKGEDMKDVITKMIDDSIRATVTFFCPDAVPSNEWHIASLREKYLGWLTDENDFKDDDLDAAEIYATLVERAHARHNEREEKYGEEVMREIERAMLLRNVDLKWMDYIDAMDELKRSVGLLGYGQKDPVVAFREYSYEMFEEMTDSLRDDTVMIVLSAEFKSDEEVKREQVAKVTSATGSGDGSEKGRTVRNDKKKVGVNDPCPCGSGKKYKKCCGKPGNNN